MVTADEVARAIVAACKETGEDPVVCLGGYVMIRARHYAMHALAHHHQDAKRSDLARFCGAPGKPEKFWDNSRRMVLTNKPHWWSEEAYGRVVAALSKNPTAKVVEKTDIPPLKMGPLPPVKPEPPKAKPEPARLESGGFRPASDTYEKEIESRRGRKVGKFTSVFTPINADFNYDIALGRRASERRECRDILAEAAANTAKLQAKLPKED